MSAQRSSARPPTPGVRDTITAPGVASSPAQWRRVLEVNLTGPFLLCQAFGRMMLEARAGSIVNVASA
jgi:NAD(P)-dependent dehydrogenase (short-subunit alcohol dehydrogenase family)